jgi:hypothetical protein
MALRRSKKQPEYDPNELADLISTPAVGSGVGSHLLIPQSDSEVATVVTLNQTPVVDSVVSPVVDFVLAPVDSIETSPIVPGRKSSPALPVEQPETAVTEVDSQEAIVVSGKQPPVDTCLEEFSKVTTVVTSPMDVLGRLWISESGEIVPDSRVRLVTSAADALSNGEEKLYQILWNSHPLRESPEARSIQAGYESLTRRTGFSRKTIQRTIDRLTAKHYIEIETPADIYRRTPTVYRVFGAAAVLERLRTHDHTHIAKIGPGVAFVAPLAGLGDRPDTVVASDLSL